MPAIAIFDYLTVPTNPVGGCHLRLLGALAAEHAFTVYAVEFENPCPERIRFVRVPVPRRPLALLFVAYHLVAPVRYLVDRLRRGARVDLVQTVEGNLAFRGVAYVHFCHRAYLRRHWRATRPPGLRGVGRWLFHRMEAAIEPLAFRRAARIVVPSAGLARELAAEYPFARDKVSVIPNPIDLDRMVRPAAFDRDAFRRGLGFGPDDLLLAFAALGHFERKGLPRLLEALRALDDPRLALVVVGGERGTVRAYERRIHRLGLDGRVRLVGMQRDVRPFLWSADAFALPSAYETFSLVAFEAAAAGLPLVVTPLHGVEELVRDGENGFVVDGSLDGLRRGLDRLLALPPEARAAMGARARADARAYGAGRFVEAWRALYGTADVA